MVLVSARVAGPRPSNALDERNLSTSDNRWALIWPVGAAKAGMADSARAVPAIQRLMVTSLLSPSQMQKGCDRPRTASRSKGCKPAKSARRDARRRPVRAVAIEPGEDRRSLGG